MIVVRQTSDAMTVRGSGLQTIGASREHVDPTAAALRGAAFAARLPRIGQAQVRAANLAYGLRSASEFPAWERTLQWRWIHRTATQPASEFTELAAHDSRAWLAIDEDRGLGGSTLIDWRALRGDARLLAWTLHYEPLIMHLCRLRGTSLEPVAMVPITEPAGADRVRLNFAVWDSNGSEIGCGTVLWNEPFEPDRLAGGVADAARSARLVEAVAIPFRLIAGELELPLADLRALECGDVVALATSSRDACVWLEAPRHALRLACRLESEKIRVETILDPFSSSRSPSMESSQPQPNLEALSVTMQFEAGEIEISVGELKTIAPGYTFSLGRTLADSPVVIRAGGRVIGRGEFVLVDQFIGVRVLELTEHGTR